MNAAIPTSWPAEERKRVQNLIEQSLEKVIQPETGGFPEDLGAIEQFEKAESIAGTSLTALQEAQRQIETELNATHARLLAASLPGSAPASPPLVQMLAGLAPSAAPTPFQDKSSVEIDKLLAQLAAVAGAADSFIQTARKKAADIPAEQDPVRRRVLAEGLMIDYSARLKESREATRRREQAQRLVQELRRRQSGDILVFSGHSSEHLFRLHTQNLKNIDVLISEPYRPEAGTTLMLRGSDNQRITLLSDLARERYPVDIDGRPWDAPRRLDLMMDGDTVWMAGIPRPGEIAELKLRLAKLGLAYSSSEQPQVSVRA